jgi:hypothetical protein
MAQTGNHNLDVEMAEIMSHSVRGKNVYLHDKKNNRSLDMRSDSLKRKSPSHADLSKFTIGKL